MKKNNNDQDDATVNLIIIIRSSMFDGPMAVKIIRNTFVLSRKAFVANCSGRYVKI